MLLNEFKEKEFVTEEFKTVATAEIEIKKLFKLVSENFNLSSLKSASVSKQCSLNIYINSDV